MSVAKHHMTRPILTNIAILRNATTAVLQSGHHKLSDDEVDRLKNILKSLRSLEFAVHSDDMDAATSKQIILKLKQTIERMRATHMRRQVSIIRLKTYLNTLGARLETLNRANENSKYRDRFVNMLKYLVMDFRDIQSQFADESKLRALKVGKVEREMELLSDRMERIEALLIDKAMAPQACDKRYCSSHGMCEVTKAGYQCTCRENYIGNRCEYEVVECSEDHICQNGGRCASVQGFVKCLCLPQFTGTLCQKRFHPCKSSPCLHSGTCLGEWQIVIKVIHLPSFEK